MNWDKAFGSLFAALLVILGIMVAVAPLRSSSVTKRLDVVATEIAAARSDLALVKSELALARRDLAATRLSLGLGSPTPPMVAEKPTAPSRDGATGPVRVTR